MALFDGDYVQFFVSKGSAQVKEQLGATNYAGQIHSSRNEGFSPCMKPGQQRANPGEETTNWGAVCGRTASTVRRAGRAQVRPDPYQSSRPGTLDGQEVKDSVGLW